MGGTHELRNSTFIPVSHTLKLSTRVFTFSFLMLHVFHIGHFFVKLDMYCTVCVIIDEFRHKLHEGTHCTNCELGRSNISFCSKLPSSRRKVSLVTIVI